MDKKGESEIKVAERELFEETGLKIKKAVSKTPFGYTSPGMTDESICYVVAEVEGEITNKNCGLLEDIEILCLNRQEALRLIKEEQKGFDIKCWLWLSWFVSDVGDVKNI